MNTLKIEASLAKQYGYSPLPSELSIKYRNFYKENIPDFLNLEGGRYLYTSYGTLLCEKYNRIVIGDYGAFVEFTTPACELIIAPGQEYRVNDERYSKNVKYIWLTTVDRSGIKIYHQKRTVKYADYKRGMYYVSVHEVSDNNNELLQLFTRLEQIIDKQCDRANDALIKSGKPSLEIICPHCKYTIKPFDWDFDEGERVPLCPNCRQEIDLPEGY